MQREKKTVTLPVSKKEVEIQEGDGYTERALLKKNKRVYETIPFYIAASVLSLDGKEKVEAKDIQELLVPDIEALLIEIYKLNHGSELWFEHQCQVCGKTSDVMVDLEELGFRELPEGIEGPDPTLDLTLPRSKKKAVIGCLKGKQETTLLDMQFAGHLDLNQADFQCLRSLDGDPNFSYEDVIKLPLADHKAIRRTRRNLISGYDVDVEITCPKCDSKDQVNILMQRDFLFSG